MYYVLHRLKAFFYIYFHVRIVFSMHSTKGNITALLRAYQKHWGDEQRGGPNSRQNQVPKYDLKVDQWIRGGWSSG